MFEAKEVIENSKETEKSKATKEFIETFIKLSDAKSKKLKQDIENLGIIKLRASDIIKIVDIVPENAIELNKIFAEVTLDADETTKILDTIKNNK